MCTRINSMCIMAKMYTTNGEHPQSEDWVEEWTLDEDGNPTDWFYREGDVYALVDHVRKVKHSKRILIVALSNSVRKAWEYKYPRLSWQKKKER